MPAAGGAWEGRKGWGDVPPRSARLPPLPQLYRLSSLGPDHRYILLITLLIFTQV